MTARPVFPTPVTAQPAGPITQDFEANGPLIVTPDSRDQWRVAMQGQGDDGVPRDVKLTPKGEVKTAVGDNVVYDLVMPQFANVTLYPLGIAGVPAEGFASFTFQYNISLSSGAGVQVSLDGVSWFNIGLTYPAAGSGVLTATVYSANALYTGSLPACRFVRCYLNNNVSNAAARISFALSRSPRVDYVAARLVDSQQYDGTTAANSTTIQQLLIGGADATKKHRVLAADGTVNPKGQGATNAASGWTLSTPFYGHVLTTAIARTEPYPYKQDQPIALQANTRGELSVDLSPLRILLEQESLNAQAAYMQTLDPNWGFELR